MYQKSLTKNYIAIKQVLYSCLVNVLSIYTKNNEGICIEDGKNLLYKDRDESRVLYISGMALRLSKSQNQKTKELADAIASRLSATCGDVFRVRIVPPGWIHLELTHVSLAFWLQNIAVGSSKGNVELGDSTLCKLGESGRWGTRELDFVGVTGEKDLRRGGDREKSLVLGGDSKIPNYLFTVQHVHARCCSIVLLAHREGLIKLREPVPDTSPAFWSVISSNPIPWLNCDETLRLNHPAERHLIAELVQVVDNMKCPDFSGSLNWKKVALNLSGAFENFWCNCRIWGEVKTTSLELAQARLGLLMATQSVLKFLLEEKLGVYALLEL